MNRFGKKVEEYRERLGIKQNALAKRIEISPAHLNRIEKGTRKPPQVEVVLAMVAALYLTQEESEEFVNLAGYSPEVLQRSGVIALPLPTMANPAMVTPPTALQSPAIQLPADDQKRALEDLKTDVQELKAGMAEVMIILKNLNSILWKIVPFHVLDPSHGEEGGQSSAYQTPGDDPGDQKTNKSVAAGSGQELAQIKNAKYNDVDSLFSNMIWEIDQLEELEQPHTGRVLFTYVVEESAYPYIPELEKRWFQVLEKAIDKGWDLFHFIWLNGDKNRTSHLVRHMRTFMGRRGNYQVYVTETMPLGGGYDFVAIDAPITKNSVGFELYARVEGNTYVQSGSVFRHSKPKLKNILDQLKEWEEGEDGFQRLLGDERSILQEKLLLLLDVDTLGQ